VHFYLLQEEMCLERSQKMEAANALLAAGSVSFSRATRAALVATDSTGVDASKPPSNPPGFSPTKTDGNRKKKRKQNDGR
jgi:hypothetical protein